MKEGRRCHIKGPKAACHIRALQGYEWKTHTDILSEDAVARKSVRVTLDPARTSLDLSGYPIARRLICFF